MKLNIAYPSTGCQKIVEVDDENKLRTFYDKKMSQEVEGDVLGDDFKGYVFKITGGNDKQGFPMKQGILTAARVRILMAEGHTCYRTRTEGERKRKSVRGCIVSSDLSVLNLVVIKKGEKEIAGLTDTVKPRRHAPKRASNIRKLFALTDKKDDVRQYNIKRRIAKEGQKAYNKYPKIQRLITPARLQRKRQVFRAAKERVKVSKKAAEEYNKLIAARYKEARDKRQATIQKRRSASTKKAAPAGATTAGAAAPAAAKKPAVAKAAAKPKADKKAAAAPAKK
jgi:small subunit ribosomal protein S6e